MGEEITLPSKAESNAPEKSAHSTGALPTLTARQSRVLDALAIAAGWLFREEVDRIAGASNGPQIILELRRKVTGEDGIEMEQVEAIDRDGRPCRPGRYRLTETGRARLQTLGWVANG